MDGHRDLRARQNLIVHGSLTRQLVRSAEQQDLYRHAMMVEMTSDHEAIAAVVALAAAEDDPAVNAQRQEQFGAAAASVLHEDHAGDAEFRDRPTIQFAHLLSAEK